MRNYWKETPNAARTLVAEFSSQMFVFTMGTGIIAVVLRSLPYTFPGLFILADIVWVLSLLLTGTLLAFFIAKWTVFPASSYHELCHNPEITFFYSSLAITASTLLNAMAQIVGSTWSGWNIACAVLFWIDIPLAIACALVPVFVAVRTQHIETGHLPPVTFLPGTALLSTGSAGAIIVDKCGLSVRVSLPIWVVSCMMIGMGFALAFVVLVSYFLRLLNAYTPEPKKIFACFLPVAALSNTALSCSLLGRLAGPSRSLLAEYGQGAVANETVGIGLYGVGVALGLGVLGIATYWMTFAFLATANDFRKSSFTTNTWAPIYPLGVYATACGQFAQDFDSPAFRTVNTIFACLIILWWFYCIARTIPLVVSGELFLAEALQEGRTWDKTERFSDMKAVHTAIQDEESQNEGDSSPQHTLVGQTSQREQGKGDVRNVFKRSSSQHQ